MQRDFDRYERPARGQYTTYQTTYTSSRSRPIVYTRQARPGANSMRGDYQPGRSSQDGSRSAPSWLDELPRDYPLPPPERPSRSVRFAQAATITPSQSISQVDRRLGRDFRDGRTTFARGEMPRGSSSLMSVSDSQFVNRRDVPAYGQRPNTLYQPNYPQMGPAGPQAPQVVNNYITTNNRQTYNIDNSRHHRVNARGQQNTQNFLYTSTANTRRDTVDASRSSQRIQGSSGHLHHHRGRHHHREYRG